MTDTTARPFVNVFADFAPGYEALLALEQATATGPLDPLLRGLVKVRASQINGCAYCVDMHWKDARAEGETEERIVMLPAWREATVYSAAERAALALTEAMTLIADHHVPVDVERAAREHFDAEAYAALVFTIATINTWNRVVITAHSPAGRYRPPARGD